MAIYKKLVVTSVLLFPFLCLLSGASSAEPDDILKFEPGDTLDEIEQKIKHNGYQFTVKSNWVFEMSDKKQRQFLNRRSPLFPKSIEALVDIGPLVNHIGKRQLPSAFDWRDYNGHSYIGPIRDQGTCGACYSFSACAAAEGAYNWANGKYDSSCADFSEAFIAFCLSDHYSGFDGCDGSDYDYQELTGLVDYGVCNDSAYPYTDHEQACQSSSWDAPRTKFLSWHRIDCNDVEAIKTAIMTYGVVDAAVDATGAFVTYSGCIYEDSYTACYSDPCYYTPTNHTVALVGWDDNGGDGYWILRNSWGTSWGESGYMRIKYTSARVACETAYLVIITIFVDPSGSCNGYTPCYDTIQAAVDSAVSGAVIKVRQGTYAESIMLNTDKSLTLQGGWDSSFTSQNPNTTFIQAPGQTTIQAPSGSLTFEMVTIKP